MDNEHTVTNHTQTVEISRLAKPTHVRKRPSRPTLGWIRLALCSGAAGHAGTGQALDRCVRNAAPGRPIRGTVSRTRTGRNRRRPDAVRVVVPTAVRVEASVNRRASTTAGLARHRIADVALDTDRADRAVALRPAGGSVVGACVAEVALGFRGAGVTVLTSDLTDIPRLLRQTSGTAAVHRIWRRPGAEHG